MTKQIDSFQKGVAVFIAIVAGLFAFTSGIFSIGWALRGQTSEIQAVDAKTVVMQLVQTEIKNGIEDEKEKVWKRFELDKDDRFEISKAVEFLKRGIN